MTITWTHCDTGEVETLECSSVEIYGPLATENWGEMSYYTTKEGYGFAYSGHFTVEPSAQESTYHCDTCGDTYEPCAHWSLESINHLSPDDFLKCQH